MKTCANNTLQYKVIMETVAIHNFSYILWWSNVVSVVWYSYTMI